MTQTLCDPMDCVACQAPLSVEFSSQNSGIGSRSLLQRIFPTQESNQSLLHCRQILYKLGNLPIKKKNKQKKPNNSQATDRRNKQRNILVIRCWFQSPMGIFSGWARLDHTLILLTWLIGPKWPRTKSRGRLSLLLGPRPKSEFWISALKESISSSNKQEESTKIKKVFGLRRRAKLVGFPPSPFFWVVWERNSVKIPWLFLCR